VLVLGIRFEERRDVELAVIAAPIGEGHRQRRRTTVIPALSLVLDSLKLDSGERRWRRRR
jgi:hypothetical protein